MTTFEIGDMFWGKSQSYPWWPCVIMTSNTNDIKRTRKKTGTQYHVQFIGQNYDACWITSNFLIKYNGTEAFESYVEQQLRSNLPPQHKLLYEMKMSSQIQTMWAQACQDAEKLFLLPLDKRSGRLPKAESYSASVVSKRSRGRKRPNRTSLKVSDSSSVSDTVSVDTKCIDVEESNHKETNLNAEIEEICRRVYITEETENRIKNSQHPINQTELENMIKEQWSVLDAATKLLYLSSESLNTSKSRVSGRKIKVPSRLRRVNELENIKKVTLRKRNSDTSIDKKKNNHSENLLNSSTQNIEEPKSQISDLSTTSFSMNQINHEAIDLSLLKSILSQNSSLEIVRIASNNYLPIMTNKCYHCLKLINGKDKQKTCRGDCQAIYHFDCVLNHKLFRSDDVNKCINCIPKEFACCLCKNSKYMKKQFMVKCQKPDCQLHFHSACVKYLYFIETTSDENDILICPNHSCLTCCREDVKHPCNGLGTFVTCIKCPASYHDNLLCIPAGSKFINKKKILCHRHIENSALSNSKLTRCFVCFSDNATLRCCRCRAVFHPKCMNMPTYTDLLKDYICPTCKLEQPMFFGQVIWAEIDNLWYPGEIVSPSLKPDISSNQSDKALLIRTIDKEEYHYVDRSEVVSFIVGESVLKDIMVASKEIIKCARKMHIIYLNWRKRMRPFQSEKFPKIGLSELVKMSSISQINSALAVSYELINRNVCDENIKNHIPQMSVAICSCANSNNDCFGSYCYNFANKIECDKENCNNKTCKNKRFMSGVFIKPVVTDVEVINNLGVKVLESFNKGDIIGECTGRLISLDTTVDLINWRLNSNYIFQVKGNIFLNCEEQGNEWRHLNHSCSPNAELVPWIVEGEFRLGVSLLKPISNEEVTINYQNCGLVLKYDFPCNCKSPHCNKTVGPTSIFATQQNIIVPRCCVDNNVIEESALVKRPLAHTIKASLNEVSLKPENSISSDQLSVSNNNGSKNKIICHRCGYHGEMILCNKINCSRKYHLQCVEMSAAPKGLWFCPKHYCAECGQAASNFCSVCPTSHCKAHAKSQKSHSCTIPAQIEEPVNNENSETVVEVVEENVMPMETNDFPPCKEDNSMESEKTDVDNDLNHARTTEEIDVNMSVQASHISLLDKKDLYSACDLIPIARKRQLEYSVNSNSNSPSQVNLTVKKLTDVKSKNEKVKKRKMSRNTKYNISNYQSTDEDESEMMKPDSVEDMGDMKCLLIPMKIEENENFISSPMIID